VRIHRPIRYQLSYLIDFAALADRCFDYCFGNLNINFPKVSTYRPIRIVNGMLKSLKTIKPESVEESTPDPSSRAKEKPAGGKNKMESKEIHRKRVTQRQPRPSDNVILDMDFAQYRQLLEHLAQRHLHSMGELTEEPRLSDEMCDDLSRLGIVSDRFANAVHHFEQLFGTHVGRNDHVDQVLERNKRAWTSGQSNCRDVFT